MSKCQVCQTETTGYRSSPFSPVSYPLCAECRRENRLPYNDLILAIQSRHNYDEHFGTNHIDQYIGPTLKFYGKTMADVLPDAEKLVEEINESWCQGEEPLY